MIKSSLIKAFKVLGILLLALLALRLVSIFFFPWYEVGSDSMSPTMEYGTHFFTNAYHYEFKEPQRGDIAVFLPYEDFEYTFWVHRVIGVPGDRVIVKDGYVTVNGIEVHQPFINGATEVDVIVPEGFVFQKGDNPETLYGLVPKDLLIGKLLFQL